MKAKGHVFKYGDNVDTDVIIPARYLNSFDAQELASHAMADIDPEFVNKVHLPESSIEMQSISDFRSSNVQRLRKELKPETKWKLILIMV